MFDKAVIIGVGQIGASTGMNLVTKRLAKEVIGVGRDAGNLRQALRCKAVNKIVGAKLVFTHQGRSRGSPLLAHLSSNDLVILATPVRTIRDLLKKMPRGPLIIDVGSTKATIVAEAKGRGLRFIGCHPIAGTEVPGAAGAEKDLFRGKVCIVTPSKGTSPSDLAQVKRLWKRLGAKVIVMTPATHDRLLATFSHLPHVIAYSLAGGAPVASVPRGFFAGLGSFGSATRVAASSPEMWRDILLENRPDVLAAIGRYTKDLKALRGLIAQRNAPGLLRHLTRAREKRLQVS
jgi:prephenate dehydrogenase